MCVRLFTKRSTPSNAWKSETEKGSTLEQARKDQEWCEAVFEFWSANLGVSGIYICT